MEGFVLVCSCGLEKWCLGWWLGGYGGSSFVGVRVLCVTMGAVGDKFVVV